MQMDVEPKIVDLPKKLRAQAAERCMPLDAYLEQFVEAEPAGALNGTISLDDFDRVLDELAAAPTNAPSLPADFSRSDIYADHN